MSAEIPYWWRVTTQIWSFLIGHSCVGNWWRVTTQIWLFLIGHSRVGNWWRVTTQIWLFLIGHSRVGNWFQQSHQCGISVLVSQTSFRGKTGGSVMKFRPFFNFLFFRQKGHTHQKHLWISSFIQAASMCGTTKQLTRAINPNARKQVPITLKYQWKGQWEGEMGNLLKKIFRKQYWLKNSSPHAINNIRQMDNTENYPRGAARLTTNDWHL